VKLKRRDRLAQERTVIAAATRVREDRAVAAMSGYQMDDVNAATLELFTATLRCIASGGAPDPEHLAFLALKALR